MAVGETRSSPLPQPINYGHTGDKKGKIFLLTLYITCLVWYYECLFCYESKERRERKEQNFGCMSESRKNLRFVHLLTSPCLSIKYWTFSMEKNFFLTLGQKSRFYPKIQILKILIFTKFTFLKSHFTQNSQFSNIKFFVISG